jgi:hypothetical protein
MVSKTIIGSSVRLWVLIWPGIKEGQRGKIHRRLPHPLEHGYKQIFCSSRAQVYVQALQSGTTVLLTLALPLLLLFGTLA